MADNNDNGSLLKASIVGAPVVAGGIITARDVLREKPLSSSGASPVTSAVGDLVGSGMPRIPTPSEVHSFMTKGVHGQRLHGDVAKQAWEWAMMGVDPGTRDGLLHYTRGIDRMTGTEAMKSIGMTLEANRSAVMGNIWRRFQANAMMLEEQRNLFGTVGSFGPVTVGRVTESFKGGLPSGLQSRFATLARAFGGPVPHISGVTRPELAESGFAVFHTTLRTELGDLRLAVPNVQDGTLFSGGTLQTKYIAPDVLIAGETGLERMSRSEYFLKELEESIAPDVGTRIKTKRDLEQAVKQLRTSVFGELESVPAVAPQARTAAQAQYESIRAGAVDVRIPTKSRDIYPGAPEYMSMHRVPTDRELSEIMQSAEGRAMGLRGGVGPKAMSEGRLSTVDWEKFDITGGPVDYGRRPEQAYRRFQLTEQATEYMRKHSRLGKYRNYEVAGQTLSNTNSLGPSLKVLYVNPEAAALAAGGQAEKLERMAMGDGEALMRRSLAEKMTFESLETQKLKLLREDLRGGNFQGLLPGEIIGTTERGVPFRYQEGMNITGMQMFESPGQGEYASIAYTQRHEMVHGSKLFGGAKAVTHVRGDREFGQAIRELTGTNADYDMIVTMDELKKNKALHRRQMLTSLAEFTQEHTALHSEKRMVNMLRQGDIAGVSAGFVKSATRGGVYSHDVFTRNLMKFAARELDMTPQAFGQAFGAVSHAYEGVEGSMGALVNAIGANNARFNEFYEAMHAGTAGGITNVSFAGPAIDVGGLGSIEPRAFEILSQPQFGPMGKDISSELLERMHKTSPEILKTHKELGMTLQSIAEDFPGKHPGREFVASAGYNADRLQAMMDEGAFMIKPGGGQKSIYVPSAKALDEAALGSLRGFETGAGNMTRSHLGKIYHDIAYTASQFAQGDIKADEYERKLGSLSDRIRKEWAPLGKGAGAVGRGKVAGSTFLRGMSATKLGAETAIREANTVGIGMASFDRMMEDMVAAGYNQKELQAMRNTFESGGKVGGMVWRHPQIGGYSMQYTNLQLAKGAGPTDVVLPEIGVNVKARAGTETVEKRLNLGPLVGMAGDKDADAYSVALLSPDNEKAVRTMINQRDNAFATRYTQHQVRMQLFKAKGASDAGLATIAKMSGDVEKLAAGQRWVGPLSVQLSTAKEALATTGRGAAAADARFLLEWLEQTPISAKHMSAAEAGGGGLSAMMQTITSSMETRNASRLNEAIRGIVASNAMSSEMLTGNVHLTEGADQIARVMNVSMGEKLSGINMETATKELMRSMSEHHANGGMRAYERLAGRGSKIKIKEIPEMLAKGAGHVNAMGRGVFSRVAAAAGSASNKLAALGESVIRNHKAIGFGFAGSIALAAALSSPKETLGPGSAMIPNARVNMNRGKAASRMSPESLQPPAHAPGTPTAPNMLRNNTTRIASGTPGRRMQVVANAGAGVNTASLAGAVSGLGAQTSVNLRDSRSPLLPHEIANKVL